MQLWGIQSSFNAHLCPNCRPKALGCHECWCRGLTLQGREEGVGSEGRGCPTSSGDGDPVWPPPAPNGARKRKVSGLRVGPQGHTVLIAEGRRKGLWPWQWRLHPPTPRPTHLGEKIAT